MGDVKTTQDASPMGFSKDIFEGDTTAKQLIISLLAEANGWEVEQWGFLGCI